jgi:TolA-binding protein
LECNADYWLGWSYEMIGNKAEALENLETYTKRVPSDQNAARVLDAVRNDKVDFKEKMANP